VGSIPAPGTCNSSRGPVDTRVRWASRAARNACARARKGAVAGQGPTQRPGGPPETLGGAPADRGHHCNAVGKDSGRPGHTQLRGLPAVPTSGRVTRSSKAGVPGETSMVAARRRDRSVRPGCEAGEQSAHRQSLQPFRSPWATPPRANGQHTGPCLRGHVGLPRQADRPSLLEGHQCRARPRRGDHARRREADRLAAASATRSAGVLRTFTVPGRAAHDGSQRVWCSPWRRGPHRSLAGVAPGPGGCSVLTTRKISRLHHRGPAGVGPYASCSQAFEGFLPLLTGVRRVLQSAWPGNRDRESSLMARASRQGARFPHD
jgi:hypothetical protein